MQRAVIYVREATKDLNDSWKIESQLQWCQAFATQSNYTITKVYQDSGCLGDTLGNPRLAMMLEDFARPDCDVKTLIIAHRNRLTRSKGIADVLATFFGENGVEVISIG